MLIFNESKRLFLGLHASDNESDDENARIERDQWYPENLQHVEAGYLDLMNSSSSDDQTSSSSSSDTPAPGCKTELGVPTWVLKEPAEGCFFERLPRDDDIHIVVEFDAARNRTGREFMKIRAEGFDDKVIESFTKKGETRNVGGWRLMPDGLTWKACNCDELRN